MISYKQELNNTVLFIQCLIINKKIFPGFLSKIHHFQGRQIWTQLNWVGLDPKETNPGLIQIRFQYI